MLARAGGSAVFRLLRLLLSWYTASVALTLVNKTIMNIFPYGSVLAAAQVGSGAVIDYVVLRRRGQTVCWGQVGPILWRVLPVSVAMLTSKLLTYFSYGLVPASMTQTVKASSPVFTVLLSWCWLGTVPRVETCLALVPIIIGVGLAATSELHFDFVGLLAALMANLPMVFHSLYAKQCLSGHKKIDTITFHLVTTTTAFVLLVPFNLYALVHLMARSAHVAAVSTPATIITAAPSLPSPSWSFALSSNPTFLVIQLMCMSCLSTYLAGVSALTFLNSVSPLTHQVSNTGKRAVIIGFSILHFRTPVSTSNIVGMCLAVAGFFCFGFMQRSTRKRKISDDSSARPSLSYDSQALGWGDEGGEGVDLSDTSVHSGPAEPDGVSYALGQRGEPGGQVKISIE